MCTSTVSRHPLTTTLAAMVVVLIATPALGRPSIRRNFFDAYPQAVGTRLDLRLNNTQHCGVCHFDFNGGGPRNPYGLAVGGTPNRTAAEILALGNLDSDLDGYSNDTEILDPGGLYTNTPTFPGLTAGNVGQVVNTPLAEILDHLTPSTGADTTPPVVTVLFPNGGQSLGSSSQQTITWTATDNSGTVAAVSVYVTFDGGVTWDPLALSMPNTGSLTWFVQNRPTTLARARVEAIDGASPPNVGSDQSDAPFTIYSTASGRVPTTLRDFDMPGTQPLGAETLNPPTNCAMCHGGYDQPEVEPYYNWQGSLMAHASIDPLFLAAMDVANQDAPESGDLCLRWYPEGRRMWLNVRFYGRDGALLSESGAYDAGTAELIHDPEIKVYEAVPVVGENIAGVVGLPPDTEFHFALNNKMLKDNRIPPLGFTNAAYAAFGGSPVGAVYADGQNYDVSDYSIPPGAARAEVTLYYQSISREFAEFLRDNSTPGGPGEAFYNLWAANGRCPPEPMVADTLLLRAPVEWTPQRLGAAGATGAQPVTP